MAKLLSVVMLLASATTMFALDRAEKCETRKLKIAGMYGLCRLHAEAKAIRSGNPPDYLKCEETFEKLWTKAETKADGACPSSGDLTAIEAFIAQLAADLASALAGGALPDCAVNLATCSSELGACTGNLDACNSAISTCTGSLATCSADLVAAQDGLSACSSALSSCETDLATCEAMPKGQRLQTGQTGCWEILDPVPCSGTGQDGEFQRGLAPDLVDGGDGTITDNRTGLTWEKLSDDDSIHDKDTVYMWWASPNAFTKIADLNAAAFAGHTDWRLPNVNELQSLVRYGGEIPTVHVLFDSGCAPGCASLSCSCTTSYRHWSSTNFQGGGGGGIIEVEYAWFVDFFTGVVSANQKWSEYHVRAVRGGP